MGLPSDDSQLAFWTLEQMLADGGFVPANVAARFARGQIFGIGQAVAAAEGARVPGSREDRPSPLTGTRAYLLHILILVGIYVTLAASLNLIAGYTGNALPTHHLAVCSRGYGKTKCSLGPWEKTSPDTRCWSS